MAKTKKETETRSIEIFMTIDAPAEAVWDALTKAEELTRWFPLEAGENPDGTVWMSFGEGFKFSGRVAASEPGKHIKIVYHQPPPDKDPSTLAPEDFAEISTEYFLEAGYGGTVVRLVHSGFGADSSWDDQYDATITGWLVELRGLRHYLEHHRGTPRRVARARVDLECSREEAWKRLIGTRGLSLEGKTEGASYSITAPTGDHLQGMVTLYHPPSNLITTVASMNQAMLKVRIEDLNGKREAQVWLSTFGVEENEVSAFQERWQSWLEQTLG